jgi:hypothetical protein
MVSHWCALMLPAEWECRVRPCIHAAAVRQFHEEWSEDRLQSLSADVLFEHIEDADLGPDSDPVSVVRTGRQGAEHLLLSVSPPATPGKLPRSFVSANARFELECLTCKHHRHNCEHIQLVAAVAEAAEDQEGEPSASSLETCGLLESFKIRGRGPFMPAHLSGRLPRSGLVKIAPSAPGVLGRARFEFRGTVCTMACEFWFRV